MCADRFAGRADVAQLVERDLPKVDVASSSLVIRSTSFPGPRGPLLTPLLGRHASRGLGAPIRLTSPRRARLTAVTHESLDVLRDHWGQWYANSPTCLEDPHVPAPPPHHRDRRPRGAPRRQPVHPARR